MNLLDLLRHPAVAHGDPVIKHLLVDWARDLVTETDRHWSRVADERGRMDDLSAEFSRGKAHALIDVTGDQQALTHFT